MNIPAIDEQCTLCGDPIGNNDEVLCDQCYEDLELDWITNDKNPNKH